MKLYKGSVLDRVKRVLPYLMIFVLMFNLFSPLAVLAEGDDTKTEEKETSDEDKKKLDDNIATNKDAWDKYKPFMEYSKELQKEITYRILTDEPLHSEEYGLLYSDQSINAKLGSGTFGLANVASSVNGQVVGDGSVDANARGLTWSPLYIFDKNKDLVKVKKLSTSNSMFSKKLSESDDTRPVFFGDLYYDEDAYNSKTKIKNYAEFNLGVRLNLLVREGFGVQVGRSKDAFQGRKVEKKTKVDRAGWASTLEYYENALAKHSLYTLNDGYWDNKFQYVWDSFATTDDVVDASPTGVTYLVPRTSDEVRKGWHWTYAISRTALLNHGTKTSNDSGAVSEMIVGVDSYGNIITHLNDVIIPYWNHSIFTEISFVSSNGKKFISHPMIKNISGNIEKDLEKSLLNSEKNDFYEFEDDKLREDCFDNVFEPGYESGGARKLKPDGFQKLKECYENEEFVKDVSSFIVEKTSEGVQDFHGKYMDYADKDGAEVYLSRSLAGYTYLMSGELETYEEAKDYIYSAEGLIERIGRILDVGLFELMRLTIAAAVADFYNSTIINFSVGDIFYTKLLTESDLWKKSLNTLLLVVVSFMGIYMLLLVIRMMMGYVTVKGIVARFLTLAVIVVMPMIIYAPAVDFAFNKPVNTLLGKEVNRMFMMDLWLQDWEKQLEEGDQLMFLPTANLRERKEEYTVQFFTSNHSSGYSLNTQEGRDITNNRPLEEDVPVVNVSAFHLKEWLEKGNGETLFSFLTHRYPTTYVGLAKYNEFSYVSDFMIGKDKFKGVNIKASDLLKQIYDSQSEGLNGEYEQSVNTIMYKSLNNLFNKGKYDNERARTVIRDMSLNSYSRKNIYGDENGFSDSTKRVFDKEVLNLPEEDVLKLTDIVDVRLKNSMYGDADVSEMVRKVNETVLNDYLTNYMHIRESSSKPYVMAEAFVVSLNSFLALNDELNYPLFPTEFEASSVTLDTYVRALYIPLSEYRPDETGLDNVSNYIALRSDMFSVTLFAISLLMLFAYGLVKFLVLFVVLMPLILWSFFYNYVWLENKNSKAWVGALGILGSFALVNFGLVLLWKGLMYQMNLSYFEKGAVGADMYPVTLFHAMALILYVALAFKFVMKPLFKAVKGDLTNLGGETMSAGALNLKGKVSAGISSFWNNLSDNKMGGKAIGNKLANTKLGSGLLAAGGAAKDAMMGGLGKKKTGMADKLDSNSIKANMNPQEAAKDAEEAGKVTDHLNSKKDKDKSGVKKPKKPVKAGDNAMVRVLGLNGVREYLAEQRVSGVADSSSLWERMKDAKDAAGKAYAESGMAFDSNHSKALQDKVKELVGISDKIDAIEDPVKKDEIKLTDDEMKTLEEMGMDSKVVSKLDFTKGNPLKLSVGSSVTAGVLSEVLANKMAVAKVGEDLYLEASSEDMKDPVKRKALLTPVMEGIENKINSIKGMTFKKDVIGTDVLPERISEREYSMASGAVTDSIVDYVKDLKSKGRDISVSVGDDGNARIVFGDSMPMAEVNGLVSGIETKSVAVSKALGLSPNASYDISANKLGKLTELLNDAGVEYSVADNVGNGLSNIKVDASYQGVLDSILADNTGIARHVTQLSSGIEKVSGNAIVATEVSRLVSAGDLEVGVDVVIENDTVIAKTDTAKRVLNSVENRFGNLKTESITDLTDAVVQVGRTIVGEGGFELSEYKRESDTEIDGHLMAGRVGRELYTLNNRSFDNAVFDETMKDIRARARKVEAGGAIAHGVELTESEKDLIQIYDRAQAVGLSFSRTSDNKLEASSIVSGQASLVEELMKKKKEVDAVIAERERKKKRQTQRGNGDPNGGGDRSVDRRNGGRNVDRRGDDDAIRESSMDRLNRRTGGGGEDNRSERSPRRHRNEEDGE